MRFKYKMKIQSEFKFSNTYLKYLYLKYSPALCVRLHDFSKVFLTKCGRLFTNILI